MNKKRVLSAAVALGLIICTSTTAYADRLQDLNNERIKYEQAIKAEQQKNGTVAKQIEDISGQVEVMDSQIEGMMRKIEDNKKQMGILQKDIETAKGEVLAAQQSIQGEQELFDKRMKVLYTKGSSNYLEVLLNSQGLTDFFNRIQSLKKVAEYDKKVMVDLKAKKEVVDAKKRELDKKMDNLVAIKTQNEAELAKLNATKASQNSLVKQLKAQKGSFEENITNYTKKLTSINSEINSILNPPNRGGAGQSSIVNYAMKFLGTPYEWGGNGPNTFDCSGFVKYVYKQFGVNLNRVACDQATQGTPVSRENLQPGDLVFFKRPGEVIHHVGMYVGNGNYIHAPQTGDVIKISVLDYRSDYYCARRYIN